MNLKEKIKKIRKSNNMSQESLAEILGISRQAITKWENGESQPDLENLVKLSNIFSTSLDKLLKDDNCTLDKMNDFEYNKDIISFLCEAKRNTYAGDMEKSKFSSRPMSCDLIYEKGKYKYFDSYFGGEKFIGEEVIFEDNLPVWAMNYSGIEINDKFSGIFLKEALSKVQINMPFRGPEIYQSGDYIYFCQVNGDFESFNGKEEMFFENKKVYECIFHGGIIK